MGEALADYFDHKYDPAYVVVVSFVLLGVALSTQLSLKSFNPWSYWSSVSLVSVFGTLAADALHILLQVPYWLSSIVFFTLLVSLFVIWKKVEGTISIAVIDTRRREVLYWCVVMATFALGTAVGDMTAITFGWGFLASGLICLAAFWIPLGVFLASKSKSVIFFWSAYVVTRPLGASFADWLALPQERGGLDFGTLSVSVVLILLIAIFVCFSRGKVRGITDKQALSQASHSLKNRRNS
jgi:uncharacterized membrane-anchored protein